MFSGSISVPSNTGCNLPYKLSKSKHFKFLKFLKFSLSTLSISERLSILNFSTQKLVRSPFID